MATGTTEAEPSNLASTSPNTPKYPSRLSITRYIQTSNAFNGSDEEDDDEKKCCTSFPSLSLEIDNEGSTCRDHLARERNLLSSLRISVTLLVVSAALVLRIRLVDIGEGGNVHFISRKWAMPLGAILFTFSVLVLISGIGDFFQAQQMMRRRYGIIRPNFLYELVIVLLTIILGTICILFLALAEL